MAKWRLRLFWAALIAIVTALGVKVYLGSLDSTEAVVVADQEIVARTLVTLDMVRTISVHQGDRDRLAPDAFVKAEDVVGRYARRTIPEGEVLRNRSTDFTAPGSARPDVATGQGALADFLPSNTRAMTLQVDQQAMLGKHLRPGDRVDLVFTSKSDSTGGVFSSMVLQQVQVLDIQQPEADGSNNEALVTVLVTPEQAVELALAKRTGVVDFALDPPDPGEPIGKTFVSPLLFSGQTEKAPAATPKAPRAGGSPDAAEPQK